MHSPLDTGKETPTKPENPSTNKPPKRLLEI